MTDARQAEQGGRAPRAPPDRVIPMLATAGAYPEDEGAWAFEPKWDGIRALVRVHQGRLRVRTRNLRDVTEAYPELHPMPRTLAGHSALLDGEIVAFDADGAVSFQALQTRIGPTKPASIARAAAATPIVYIAFDLLFLDGEDLTGRPYAERRARLLALALDAPAWRVSYAAVGEGRHILEEPRLEGVVAKRLDAPYVPGARTGAWRKVKRKARQELVVGGWTEGRGGRGATLGALLLGVHDDEGRLRYAGSVGTGFRDADLEALLAKLRPLTRGTSPFHAVGPAPPPGATFVEPRLVCEVAFTEWTREGKLRHPSYKGLRSDKRPRDVVREA